MLTKVASQIVRGFCMGSADVVPGVSGGTIALVLGIYAQLVDQVRTGARMLGSAAKGDLRSARTRFSEIDWWFLLPLLAGIGLAVLSLASLIDHLLEDEPVRTAAVFFGLVVGSVLVTARDVGRLDAPRWAILVLTGVATFLLLGLRSGPAHDPTLLLVFGAGAVAICAMILPGVSGSFILLMIGMYDFVLDAVNERDLVVGFVFALGAVLGLGLFSQILGWALERHELTVMAGLIGLMVGSLRVLWPWPSGTAGTSLGSPTADTRVILENDVAVSAGVDPWVPVVLALVGVAGVIALAAFARHRETAETIHALAGDS